MDEKVNVPFPKSLAQWGNLGFPSLNILATTPTARVSLNKPIGTIILYCTLMTFI